MADKIEALKAALDVQVEQFFKDNPAHEKVYGTIDGNIFLEKNLSDAKNHALSSGLELHEFVKQEAGEGDVVKSEGGEGDIAGKKQDDANGTDAANNTAADTKKENRNGKAAKK